MCPWFGWMFVEVCVTIFASFSEMTTWMSFPESVAPFFGETNEILAVLEGRGPGAGDSVGVVGVGLGLDVQAAKATATAARTPTSVLRRVIAPLIVRWVGRNSLKA